MKNNVFILCFFITFSLVGQKTYHKSFYEEGTLKEEGWLENNKKTDYWIFYYKNGNIKKEGSFKNNLPVKYWHFYYENSFKKRKDILLMDYQTNGGSFTIIKEVFIKNVKSKTIKKTVTVYYTKNIR